MIIFHSTFSTRVGPFTAAVNEAGALVATAFGKLPALRARLSSTGRASDFRSDAPRLREVRAEIAAYFAGETRTFSTPTSPTGSPFQQRVWAALRKIPHGQTRSYGELARSLKTAARAIGRANATNPICLIVPCHRVIGADGSLTGFAFGEDLKRVLLEHEGWSPQTPAEVRSQISR